uniref:Gustatory receptor n=1 Tax=Anopheles culicifacies TaxID=139723 RepID=A0A182MQZ1_9DIPT
MSYDIRITKAVLVLYKWFGQLYGILPFSSNAFIFVRSRPMLWYSRMIAAFLLVIYPCAYIVLLKNHSFPMLAISYYLVMIQFTINYIIVLVLYLQVLFDPSSLLDVLNELIDSAQAILQYTYSSGKSTVGRRLLFKTIVIDVLQSFSWYGTFIWLQRTFGLSYVFAFWLNTIAVMQIVSVMNILLSVLHWGTFLYRLINERVQIIIEHVGKMGDAAHYRDSANHGERRIGSTQLEQFCVSKWFTIWSYGLALTLFCIYPCVYVSLMGDIPYPDLSLVNYLVWVQMILHYVALTLMYIHLLPSRTVICDILNSLAYIFGALNAGQPWKAKQTKRNILRNAFKVILSDNIVCGLFAFYCGQYITRGNVRSEILWLFNIFAIWQSAIFTNMIVFLLNTGSHFYGMLNHSICQHMRHLRSSLYSDVKTSKSITYEPLDTIRQNHHFVTTIVRTGIGIVSLPMSCLLLVQFTIIITEIFYAYTSIVQDIKNDVDVPLGTYMSSILFAAFEAIQFYYIISASSEITEQAEKTGILLNEFMPTAPSMRVERCMIATITSYLIMLVQFQLAEI